MPATPRRWGRRQVLHSGAAALGGIGAGWTAAAAALPATTSPADAAAGAAPGAVGPPLGGRTVGFHGPYQAGVATPPQAQLSLLGLDLRPDADRDALARMMRLLSDDAARLTRGLPALADTEPELASHPASLTITFGFGPRVMNDLIGADRRMQELPAFRTDRLDPAWGQTDVAVQICADDPLTVAHARRMILKDSHAFARLRWVQDGYRYASGTVSEGTTMRNVMGQVDGTVNPAEADPDFTGLVWSADPSMSGGTFMVVRRIRAEMETWDKVDRAGREAAVGRRLDNGAPLTGSSEDDAPDFLATDAVGLPVIDPASHVARAHSEDPREKIVRRAYNYTVADASRRTGEDSGLVFVAFAADVDAQFVPIQRRLAEADRLNEWVTTIGSAVYAVPSGAAEGEFVAEGLLT